MMVVMEPLPVEALIATCVIAALAALVIVLGA